MIGSTVEQSKKLKSSVHSPSIPLTDLSLEITHDVVAHAFLVRRSIGNDY